jgi:hypothetical protein
MKWRRVIGWWCRTADGELVTYQRPNAALVAWIGLWLLSAVTSQRAETLSSILWAGAVTAAMYWGYLELTSGVNRLRRLAGGAAIVWIILSVAGRL